MNSPIDLNEVRRAWTQRYGPNLARRMMAGAYGAAYDSAPPRSPGRARDQEEEDASGLRQIKVFLKNRLSKEDYARLEQMLAALAGGGEQDDELHRRDPLASGEGQDEPEAFAGQPRPGGRFAHDARGGGYFDLFPGNAGVKVW
jgi:hypothetical protein